MSAWAVNKRRYTNSYTKCSHRSTFLTKTIRVWQKTPPPPVDDYKTATSPKKGRNFSLKLNFVHFRPSGGCSALCFPFFFFIRCAANKKCPGSQQSIKTRTMKTSRPVHDPESPNFLPTLPIRCQRKKQQIEFSHQHASNYSWKGNNWTRRWKQRVRAE